MTALTAEQGIDEHLHVRRDETVLVFGGTGAVATLAIQFARRKGARVVTTALGRVAQTLVRTRGAAVSFDARNGKELELHHEVHLVDYARIAALVSSLATLGGALDAVLETNAAVRDAAFCIRQTERRGRDRVGG